MYVVGVDLAAKPGNPSGFAVWRGGKIMCWSESSDDERVLEVCRKAELVVFDAPLTESDRPFRRRDEIFRRYAPVLPLTFPGMRELSRRARSLVRRLEVEVYETYPRAAERFISLHGNPVDEHSRDAAICCAVGLAVSEGEAHVFGEPPKAALPKRELSVPVRALTAPPDV
ncbi:hypothetical protein [Methanopyrus kandleri]